MTTKKIIWVTLFTLFIVIQNSSLLQSQTSNKTRVCILPFSFSDSNFKNISQKIYQILKKNIQKNEKFELISIEEIQRRIPELADSASLNNETRRKLAELFKVDLILTGEILGRSSFGYRLSYRYINASTNARLSSGTISSKNYHFISSTIVRYLAFHTRRSLFTFGSNQSQEQDNKPKWKVCVVPFFTKNAEIQSSVREYNEKIIEQLESTGIIQIVSFNKIKKFLPALKDSSQFKFEMHEAFYNKLNVDFIVYGEMEKARPPHNRVVRMMTNIMIAHSGVIRHTIMINYLEGHYQAILRDFRTARSTHHFLEQNRQNPIKNNLVTLWERELAHIRRKSSQQITGNIAPGSVIEEPNEGDSYFHYLYAPQNFQNSGNTYPLILFLHGAGQRSRQLHPKVLTTSPLAPLFGIRNGQIVLDRNRLPYLNNYVKGSFVLIPQIYEEQFVNEKLAKLLIKIIKKYPVDIKRIYVLGVSLGGLGVWKFGEIFHSQVAALVPMCGSNFYSGNIWDGSMRINPIPPLQNIPLWAFHAWDDDILSVVHTFLAFTAIIPGKVFPADRYILKGYPHSRNNPRLPADTDCTISYYNNDLGPWERGIVYPKGKSTFTLYRTGKHNVWDPTYANPIFWKWLFSQRQ